MTTRNDGPAGFAVLIDGRLYAHGKTFAEATADFSRQIAGASSAMKSRMKARADIVCLDADEASEVAECIAADAIAWA
jgi:hypothetical protein